MTVSVLFVCLGNICRSPSAQGALQLQVARAGLSEYFSIDSCGTAAFNVGKPPDPRAVAAAQRAGVDISTQVARQIDDNDYQRFEYIIAMDRMNLGNIETWAPADYTGDLKLLLDYSPATGNSQIPDPYYAEAEQFDAVFAALETATLYLLKHLQNKHEF